MTGNRRARRQMGAESISNAYAGSYPKVWDAHVGLPYVQFANRVAEFAAGAGLLREGARVLELFCGSGKGATQFLAKGAQVVGVDLSPGMVQLCKQNNRGAVKKGTARFLVADAVKLPPLGRFDLALALGRSVVLLPSEEAVRECFRQVHARVHKGGYFLFDMPSVASCSRLGSTIEETESSIFILRTMSYDGGRRLLWNSSGAVRTESGKFLRFSNMSTVIPLSPQFLLSELSAAGWREVEYLSTRDLKVPTNPDTDYSYVVKAQA